MTKKDTGFATLNAKEDVAKKVKIIAATEDMKVYDVIEAALKCKYPGYFNEKITAKNTRE